MPNSIAAADIEALSKLALQNFYSKDAMQILEKRLSELLYNNTKGDNNIITHLLELEKNPVNNKVKLKNLHNGEIILDLYEIMFIFLRIKFIDKQMELYNINLQTIEKPLIAIDEVAKQSEEYKGKADTIYDNINNIITTGANPILNMLYSTKIVEMCQ